MPLCRLEHSEDKMDNDLEDAHSSLLTHFPFTPRGSTVSGRHLPAIDPVPSGVTTKNDPPSMSSMFVVVSP